MHIHLIALFLVVVFGAFAVYVVRLLFTAQPARNIAMAVVALGIILGLLVACGLIGANWFTVSP